MEHDQMIRDFIRSRLLNTVDILNNTKKQIPFDKLVAMQAGEYHPEVKRFFQLAHNRRIMGAYRYGTFEDNKDADPGSKIADHIIEKIENYKQTGNLEMLVDVTNYCLLEFLHSSHPNKHFESGDDTHHTDVWKFGG